MKVDERKLIEELLDTVLWMSGSKDFSPGGQAHQGWQDTQPLITRANVYLGRERHQ